VRDLLDDDVVHEVLEILPVHRAQLERATVDDDAGRLTATGRKQPGKRNSRGADLVLDRPDVERGNFLDGEVELAHPVPPADLDVLDRIEHEVVEALRRRLCDRDLARRERPTRPPATPVAAASSRACGHGGSL